MSERNKDLTQGVLTRSKTVLRNSATSPGSSPEEEVKVTHGSSAKGTEQTSEPEVKVQKEQDTTSDSLVLQKSFNISEELGASPPLSPLEKKDHEEKHTHTLAREFSTDSLENTQADGQGVYQTDTSVQPDPIATISQEQVARMVK